MTYIVDNSMLAAGAECDLREVLEFGFGYQHKGAKLAAEAGKAIHVARAEFWKGAKAQECINKLVEYYEPVVSATPPGPEDERLSLANVRDVAWAVMADGRKQLDAFPFVPWGDYVEQGVKVGLCEGIELFALVDCPAQDKTTGVPVVVDTKSTGQLSDWWAKKWRRASQMSGYAYAMSVWQGGDGLSVQRVYIDAIEVKLLPSSSSKCKVHKVPYSECRLQHVKSEVLVCMRSPETIKKWYKTAVDLAKKCMGLNKSFTDLSLLPYLDAQGEFNGGCTFCQYKDFCGSDRSLTVLESDYVVDKWEPWLAKGE